MEVTLNVWNSTTSELLHRFDHIHRSETMLVRPHPYLPNYIASCDDRGRKLFLSPLFTSIFVCY